MTYSRLQLSSIVLLLTTLAFLGPGRALAQDTTVGIAQQAVTRAGLNGVQAPTPLTLQATADAGSMRDNSSTASIAWTTSIVVDVTLLMAALAFVSAAIVPTLWPLRSRRTKLLTVRFSEPKHSGPRRTKANREGRA